MLPPPDTATQEKMARSKVPQEIVARRVEGTATPVTNQNRRVLLVPQIRAKWTGIKWSKWMMVLFGTSWKVAVTLATLLGIASGWVAMVPRISVSQTQALDPTDPFSTPFIVENQGPLPMMNVVVNCALGNTSAGAWQMMMGDSDIFQMSPEQHFKEVLPGERGTIPCGYRFAEKVNYSDVTLIVSFRVAFTLFHMERKFRFVTALGQDRNLYWFPEPKRE